MHITTSLYIYFSLPLIPTADQLTTQGWSLEHGMPVHNFYCPNVMKQALSSCTALKFTFNLQLSKSWLSLFCRNSSIITISHTPTFLRSLEGNAEGRERGEKCGEYYCPGLAVRNTVGTQMLHRTGLGLLGKELGLLFPTSSYVPLQYKGSFAFSFYHPYSS